MTRTLAERSAFAEKLRGLRQGISENIVDEFFRTHPEWKERYGERGRKLSLEDAAYHIDFLASAVESGSTSGFENYAVWTGRVLQARDIGPGVLIESLRLIQKALMPYLTSDESAEAGSYIEAACSALLKPASQEATKKEATGLGLDNSLFLQAILSGQRKAALNIAVESFNKGHRIEDIYIEVFQNALYEIGRLWEGNKITVAQEHMATAITQYVIAQMYQKITPVDVKRGRIVITGVQGELHQVGANMVADMLEADGWDVRFLGTNMPHEGILQEIEDHKADVFGISATMLFNLPQVIRLAEAVRGKFGDSVKIILGGSAIRSAGNISSEIGSSGYAVDLRAAINLARGLAKVKTQQ